MIYMTPKADMGPPDILNIFVMFLTFKNVQFILFFIDFHYVDRYPYSTRSYQSMGAMGSVSDPCGQLVGHMTSHMNRSVTANNAVQHGTPSAFSSGKQTDNDNQTHIIF